MSQAIRDLLGSKKFVMGLAAIAVVLGGYAARKLGIDVDQTLIEHAWMTLLALIGAQGIADFGKSAAQVNASTPSTPPLLMRADDVAASPAPAPVPTSKPAGSPIARTAGVLVAVMACLWFASALPACTKTELTAAETKAKAALVNCTAQQLGSTPGLDLATLVAVANVMAAERAKCTPTSGPSAGSLDWACVESDLVGEGKVIGGCALVKLVLGSSPAPTTAARTTAAATPMDPGRAALEDFRTRVAEGATYHTSAGDL